MTEKPSFKAKPEDIAKMTAALEAFRGYRWWFETESQGDKERLLAPMVMQNLKLGLESGTLIPTFAQFENLLETAIYYEMECRLLREKTAQNA